MSKPVIPIFRIDDHCQTIFDNIKVTSFNEVHCTVSEFSENHRHEYYEIVWLKKGKGVHLIDTVSYPYSGSVIFLLSPGQMHQIEPVEKAEGYVIKFLPSLFNDARELSTYLYVTGLFDNIQARPVVKVTPLGHSIIEDVILHMEREFNSAEEDTERILVSYLRILLTHIARMKRDQLSKERAPFDAGYSTFQNYKIAVEKDFRRQHSVQYYAKALSASPRVINTLSKKYTGKTAGEVIADRLMLEAKRELYHNSRSIKEISYDLGFEDPAYFTRFFKKHAGASPHEYRISNHPIVRMNAG